MDLIGVILFLWARYMYTSEKQMWIAYHAEAPNQILETDVLVNMEDGSVSDMTLKTPFKFLKTDMW